MKKNTRSLSSEDWKLILWHRIEIVVLEITVGVSITQKHWRQSVHCRRSTMTCSYHMSHERSKLMKPCQTHMQLIPFFSLPKLKRCANYSAGKFGCPKNKKGKKKESYYVRFLFHIHNWSASLQSCILYFHSIIKT